MTVTIGLAFLAGLASFLSPCVFSLVPAYVSYLSGQSIAALKQNQDNRKRLDTFLHGLAFVLGFSIVFISLGATASAIGGFLYFLKDYLAKIGGIAVVLFGLHLTGIIRFPFLDFDIRARAKIGGKRNYLSSVLMGVFFSAGWAPCIGPVLSSILALAIHDGSISEGTRLLSAYSVGLAIPFLFAALGIGWVTKTLLKYNKLTRYVEIGMGIVLIIVGIMLFFGVLARLNQFGLFFDFGL